MNLNFTSSLLVIVMCISLTGCGTTYQTAQQSEQATSVKYDPYTKTKTIESPRLDLRWSSGYGKCLLSANDKHGETTYGLVVLVNKLEWPFLDSAADIHGKEYQVVKLESSVQSPWCQEIVAVVLTKEDLQTAATSGLDVKVYGKGGDAVVQLPNYFVAGFLEKVNAESQ